jgi:hypothetical protein
MSTHENGPGDREPGRDEDLNAPAQVMAFTCSCGAAYEFMRSGVRANRNDKRRPGAVDLPDLRRRTRLLVGSVSDFDTQLEPMNEAHSERCLTNSRWASWCGSARLPFRMGLPRSMRLSA